MNFDAEVDDAVANELVPETKGAAALLSFECPRCRREVSSAYYGPCQDCRAELRSVFATAKRDVVAAPYEPKMNVTPNQVAIKD